MLKITNGFNITVTNPRGAHKHLHSTAARYSAAIAHGSGEGCGDARAVGPAAPGAKQGC